MHHEQLIAHVRERAGVGAADGERTLRVVLEGLFDCLDEHDARDLRAELPAELRTLVTAGAAPTHLSRDAFVARIARRLEVNPEEARERVRAVFATLREAVTWSPVEDVILALDREYADLLA